MAAGDNGHAIASVAAHDDRLVVRLDGQLNHDRSADTQAELVQLITQRQPRSLVLNLSDVPHLDSSGIAMLLVARRRLGGKTGCVILVGVSEAVLGLLKAVKLEALFPIVDTEEAADAIRPE